MIPSSGAAQRPNASFPVTLPDGTKIYVEAQTPTGEGTISGVLDIPQDFSQVSKGICSLANALLAPLKAAAPTGITLEFGFDLKAEPSGLFAMLVKGEAGGSMKVTVEWKPE
jgi:hypothetical protein